MDNVILGNYDKLNSRGRDFIDCALRAAMSQPAFLFDIPEEEMLEIKRQQEEYERVRKIEKEKNEQCFEKIEAECKGFTKEDYIAKLNEVLSSIETYKVRWFYRFIMGRLACDLEGGVCHE